MDGITILSFQKILKKIVFIGGGMNCWGWATWKDRWKNYKKSLKINKKMEKK